MSKKYTDLQEQGIGGALVSGIASGLRSGASSRVQQARDAIGTGRAPGTSHITNVRPVLRRLFQIVAAETGYDLAFTGVSGRTIMSLSDYGTDRKSRGRHGWTTPRGIDRTGFFLMIQTPGDRRNVTDPKVWDEVMTSVAKNAADLRLNMSMDFTADKFGTNAMIEFGRGLLSFDMPDRSERKIHDMGYANWPASEEFRNSYWWQAGYRTGRVHVPADAWPSIIGTVPSWARRATRYLR